jgi:hypothetical protein
MAARTVQIVRRLCMQCHILHVVSCTLHAVSMTRHASCMRCQWPPPRMPCACVVNDPAWTRACGVNDTACIFNFFFSASPFCIYLSLFEVVQKYYCACGADDTSCILKNSNNFANSNLYLKRLQPLNQGPRTEVLMKKNEGRKFRNPVPLKPTLLGSIFNNDIWLEFRVSIHVLKNSAVWAE